MRIKISPVVGSLLVLVTTLNAPADEKQTRSYE